MNTSEVREMLVRKDDAGEYKIPFLVVVDAFHSETVNFADLVLPGHDVSRALRRDIVARPSDLRAGRCRGRHPPPGAATSTATFAPWQDVLVELASRLGFPAFTRPDGSRKFRDYKDFIVNYEKFPGIGFLAGWRGKNGESHLRGEPNPKQWEKYIENQSFFVYPWPENMRYYRYANKDYLEFAEKHALFGTPPVQVIMQMYSEPLQKFRLAGQGLYDGPQPSSPVDCERLARYFDPLPFWYEPLESARVAHDEYPLHAITQRPMMMYHSWDSQNAWLRQIMAENFLYMNRGTAQRLGLADLDWVWVESHHGRIRCQLKTMEGCRGEHRLDLERGRQAARDLGARRRRIGSDDGIPAQSPDIGAAAQRCGGRSASDQLRSGHGPGRVVRLARERHANALPAKPACGRASPPSKRLPGDDGSRPSQYCA